MTLSVIAFLPLNCFHFLCLQACSASVFAFLTLLIVFRVFTPVVSLCLSWCWMYLTDFWKILPVWLVHLNRSFILPCENAFTLWKCFYPVKMLLPCENALFVTVIVCFNLIVLRRSYCCYCPMLCSFVCPCPVCMAFDCLFICHDCDVLIELLSWTVLTICLLWLFIFVVCCFVTWLCVLVHVCN